MTPTDKQCLQWKAAAPTDGNQLVGVFQQFVMGEKEKLVQRKHQVAKQIKESQLAQFVEFSKTFTVSLAGCGVFATEIKQA